MTSRPHPSRLGEIVGGKYKIVRLLAAGGMGAVYEAQHTVVKRRFAIKFLHPDLATRRDILTRFQREAEAAGALESENVAAAIDFGIVPDGTPYIVMELLAGESLESLLVREQVLPVTRAADLVAQACRGVQAAHAAGIVHRDLKPQNLFVCRRQDGTDLVKVLDFGVAKLQAINDGQTGTGTGAVLGTPSYMSPEQARGANVLDHRADVYALGAILYQLVSGQKPHPGDSNNAILYHISTQPPVPLASVKAELPSPLVAIIERALASDPDARPASADALGAALTPFAGREVWPEAKPAPPVDPTPVDTAASARAVPPRRARVIAVAAVGLVAVAIVVVRAARTPTPAPAPAPVASEPTAVPAAPIAAPVQPSLLEPGSPPPAQATSSGVPALPPARPGVRPPRERPNLPRTLDGTPPVSRPPLPAAGAAVDARPEPVTFNQQNPYN